MILSIPTLALGLALALLAAQEPTSRVPVEVEAPPARAAAQLPAGTEVRLHDVAHLTGHTRLADLVRGIAATADSADVEGVLARLDRLQHRRDEVRSTTDSLLATIREMIAPPLEADVQRVDHVGSGRLALVGTPAQHEWLEQFLAAASEFDGLVDVQARILVLERGRLAELSQVQSGAVLDEAQVAALLGALGRGTDQLITSPRITAFPFQRAELSVVEQTAYIRDYELKVLPEQQSEIADPVIDIVESGLQMSLRGIPLADEKLSIVAHLEYATLERPIPTFETTLGAGGHTVTIQLPQVTKVKLEGRFELRSTETLLLATVDPAGESEVLALLKVTRVAIEAELPEER